MRKSHHRTGRVVVGLLLLFVTLMTVHPAQSAEQHGEKVRLKGQILDARTKKGISFATLYIKEFSTGFVCDVNGNFIAPVLPQGSINLSVQCLNYAPKKLLIHLTKDTSVTIYLHRQSLSLGEVEVTAQYSKDKGSSATINQAALEYIQPTSLMDVLQLLPGNVLKNNSLHRFNLIGMRQAGEDVNTSLGTAIINDGTPISNDGVRLQMSGLTGEDPYDPYGGNDRTVTRRLTMNAGVDMRNLSTDHIERVEVVRGISSVKEGNLSSGAIHVHSKQGQSPWQLRAKADPLNKLIYAGKGFRLSERGGTLHVGLDVLSSTVDVRERLERYTRSTAQANYNNKYNVGGKSIDLNIRFNQNFSLNNVKADELIVENNESYRTEYLRSSLAAKTNILLNLPFIESIEGLASFDLSRDLLSRHKMVLSSSGPRSMPLSTEEGEHEGLFLPSKYYTDYSVENIPFYFFTQWNFISSFNTGRFMRHRLLYGVESRTTKNFGYGAQVDERRPPYPTDNSFIRPRPNYVIPAMVYLTGYIEDKLNIALSESCHIDLSAGVRATQMLNLPKEYKLSKKLIAEPRLQARVIFDHAIDNKVLQNVLRIGYGEENKLPTLDQLYPDKVYRDFMVLNAYFQDPERDYLLTYTTIHDPSNPNLRENNNRKFECGWDLSYSGYEVSVTLFQELSNNGFEYFPNYYPIAFYRYLEPLHPIVGKPTKEDYVEEFHKDFTQFTRVSNSAKTIKKGIEYRVKTPYLPVIRTNVEVNGAYYKTVYTRGVPVMYRPSIVEFGQKYPYVGLYEGDTHQYRTRLNTNLQFNTHIPRFGLVFSNILQFIWFSTSRKGEEESVYPMGYYDLDGVYHSTTVEEIQQNPKLRDLGRVRAEIYYRTERKPIAIRLDFKVTKELGSKTRISFFVNNIIDVNPSYKSAKMITKREWAIPFFGAELMLNL